MSATLAAAAPAAAVPVAAVPSKHRPNPSSGPQPAPWRCSRCSAAYPAWQPRCEGCGSWNSLQNPAARRAKVLEPVRRLAEVPAHAERRLHTAVGELDRVLGGGLVPGSVVLLRGEPGAGKSTLLLQAAAAVAQASGGVGHPVLYGAAEEAPGQVAARARRLGIPDTLPLHLAGTGDIEALLEAAGELSPSLLVVDSLHAFAARDLHAAPGTPSQVAAVAQRLLAFCRSTAIPAVVVAHVNADYAVRGGFEVVHQFDASLTLERGPLLRVLRADKNRFGDVDEVGLFVMEGDGLHGLPSGAALLDDGRRDDLPGVCVAAALEGSRVILAEVQALVGPAKFGTPRVASTGYPSDRLAMVMAVLERRVGLPRLADSDVFLTVAGGLRLRDPAADLAVALAVASSAREVPLPPDLAAAGEVDLSGRVRRVARLDDRGKEARRAGLRPWAVEDASTVGDALDALGVTARSSGGDVSGGVAGVGEIVGGENGEQGR